MGVLRVILALSVVIGHADHSLGLPGLDTTFAVRSFYVISGFYMALVLNTKYRGKPYYVFLRSRYLRLFPAYAAVLTLTALYGLITYQARGTVEWPFQEWARSIEDLTVPTLAILVLTNVFLVGQDILTYARVASDGSLALMEASSQGLGVFFLVPQAWTLGIEILFYTVAPFLVTRSAAFVTGVLATSLLCKLFLFPLAGFDAEALGYRFFPFELAFFAAGSLSYRLYDRIRTLESRPVVPAVAAAALLAAYIFAPDGFPAWARYAVLALGIPLLFLVTKRIALDRFVGELSYHIYISHILILHMVSQHTRLGTEGCGVLATIALSLALHLLLDSRTEPWRERLIRRSIRSFPAARPAFAVCCAAVLLVSVPVAAKYHSQEKHLASSLFLADYNLLADPPKAILLLGLRHREAGTTDPFRYGFGDKSELIFSLPRREDMDLHFELACSGDARDVFVSFNDIFLERFRLDGSGSVYRRYTLPGRKSGNVIRFAYPSPGQADAPDVPAVVFRQLRLTPRQPD